MKLILSMGLICLAVSMIGCSGGPKDAARTFVNSKVEIEHGLKLDASKLVYKKIKADAEQATIEVSGRIDCKGQLHLVKENGQWVVK